MAEDGDEISARLLGESVNVWRPSAAVSRVMGGLVVAGAMIALGCTVVTGVAAQKSSWDLTKNATPSVLGSRDQSRPYPFSVKLHRSFYVTRDEAAEYDVAWHRFLMTLPWSLGLALLWLVIKISSRRE